MNRALTWSRRGCLRLRRLTPADLPGLNWAGGLDNRRLRLLEPLAPPEQAASLVAAFPSLQHAVELDSRLVGAVLARPAQSVEEVTHPWTQRDPLVGQQPASSASPVLFGCGALWLDALNARQIADTLRLARQALVQQLGWPATVSVVPAAGWARWRAQMSADAYVQQVHAGLHDNRLSVFLKRGYAMRGFWHDEHDVHVVMVWENRPR